MKTTIPKWFNMQMGWLVLWIISVVLSAIYYEPNLINASGHASKICNLNGLGNTFDKIIKPEFWLGLFTLLFSLIGLRFIIKGFSSRWYWVSDFRWLIFTILLLLILFLIHGGCTK